jgi:hypothetical protein
MRAWLRSSAATAGNWRIGTNRAVATCQDDNALAPIWRITVRRSAALQIDTQLSGGEKAFIALPMAAGFVFGLLPLLIPAQFASISGFPGNDTYVYRLAGAATLGYGIGLLLALRAGLWVPIRPLIAATLTFNAASLIACVAAFADGSATWIVYLITAASVLFTIGTALLLRRRPRVPRVQPDISPLFSFLLAALSAVALATGLLPLVIPVQYGQLFGFRATDVFLYRQAGAATLGYAVMGGVLIASRRWADIRFGVIMAVVFNAAALVVSVVYLIAGGASWAPLVIGPASLFATLVGALAIFKQGRLKSV